MVDWEELVRREGSAVWHAIHRVVRNRADADECFQETWADAFQLSTRQAVSNWPALLKRLAIARAVDRVRRRLRRTRREDAIDISTVLSIEASPREQAETTELAAALSWALAQISARQAELFCLHELEDWSYLEIAAHFSLSTSAVGVLLHRARRKLQALLTSTLQRHE